MKSELRQKTASSLGIWTSRKGKLPHPGMPLDLQTLTGRYPIPACPSLRWTKLGMFQIWNQGHICKLLSTWKRSFTLENTSSSKPSNGRPTEWQQGLASKVKNFVNRNNRVIVLSFSCRVLSRSKKHFKHIFPVSGLFHWVNLFGCSCRNVNSTEVPRLLAKASTFPEVGLATFSEIICICSKSDPNKSWGCLQEKAMIWGGFFWF